MFSFSGKSKLSCALLGAAVAGAMGATNVGAQIVLTSPYGSLSTNPIVSAVTGGYSWVYSLALQPNTGVASGDSFAVIDFGGYVSATWSLTNNSGWAISEAYVYNPGAIYSPPTSPANSPSVADVILTYTGSSFGNGSSSEVALGTLTLVTTSEIATPSTLGSISLGSYGFSDISPSTDGYNQTNVLVPGSPLPAGPLPLPATFWPGLGTLAAMALVGGVKLRKKFV